MRSSLPVLAFLSLLLPTQALALTQPDGTPIPSGVGCAPNNKLTGLSQIFACVCDAGGGSCNIGATCVGPQTCDDGQNGNCETTIWHSSNDGCAPTNLSGLDPIAEASTVPETFYPSCPLHFYMISRGTSSFRDAFGWYNVTGQKPEASDLHPMLDCNKISGNKVDLDILSDPAWKGGEIGFFAVTPEASAIPGTCTGGNCCASVERALNGEGYIYYSERKYNPDFIGDASFIHLLVYQSQVFVNIQFYFAWEDLLGAPEADFTDLVTGVNGVQCTGAGLPCTTDQIGLCGTGVTACDHGALVCQPAFTPGDEVCDGLDNDCDGVVDDDATCPTPGDICQHGTCAPPCSDSELPCLDPATTCDEVTGFCIDMACTGIHCPDGKICVQGQCQAPCDGIVCPHGQDCVGDACVDLCASAACAAGQVCRHGVCLGGCAQCGGITCKFPEKCDFAATAECLDLSCEGGCPEGTYCESGVCKDACDGADCPGTEKCEKGQCVPPPVEGLGGGFGEGGSPPIAGSGGTGGAPAASGAGNVDEGSTCGCRVAGDEHDPWGLLALAGAAVGAASRRTSRRKHRGAVGRCAQ